MGLAAHKRPQFSFPPASRDETKAFNSSFHPQASVHAAHGPTEAAGSSFESKTRRSLRRIAALQSGVASGSGSHPPVSLRADRSDLRVSFPVSSPLRDPRVRVTRSAFLVQSHYKVATLASAGECFSPTVPTFIFINTSGEKLTCIVIGTRAQWGR